jgi:hypothetical protein
MNQSTFNPSADNADLMLADFYIGATEPTEPDVEEELARTATIDYSGTTPTVKVGGSWKVFTPVFSKESTTVDKWFISDENGDISGSTNYTIERDGEKLKLKVALNYNLIGTVIVVQVVGSDGSTAELSVEVI